MYQTSASLLRDTVSDPIPTSCNNQQLLRLSYLIEMLKVVRIAKKIKKMSRFGFLLSVKITEDLEVQPNSSPNSIWP